MAPRCGDKVRRHSPIVKTLLRTGPARQSPLLTAVTASAVFLCYRRGSERSRNFAR